MNITPQMLSGLMKAIPASKVAEARAQAVATCRNLESQIGDKMLLVLSLSTTAEAFDISLYKGSGEGIISYEVQTLDDIFQAFENIKNIDFSQIKKQNQNAELTTPTDNTRAIAAPTDNTDESEHYSHNGGADPYDHHIPAITAGNADFK